MITRVVECLVIMCTEAACLSAKDGYVVAKSAWSVSVRGLSARVEVCSRHDADPLHCIVKLEIRNVTNMEFRVIAPPVLHLTVAGLNGASPEPADIDGGGLFPQFKVFTLTPGTSKTIPAFRPIDAEPPGDHSSKGVWLLKPGEYLLEGTLHVPIESGSKRVTILLKPCKNIVTKKSLLLDVYGESY